VNVITEIIPGRVPLTIIVHMKDRRHGVLQRLSFFVYDNDLTFSRDEVNVTFE
jgi:hypothetical protein